MPPVPPDRVLSIGTGGADSPGGPGAGGGQVPAFRVETRRDTSLTWQDLNPGQRGGGDDSGASRSPGRGGPGRPVDGDTLMVAEGNAELTAAQSGLES